MATATGPAGGASNQAAAGANATTADDALSQAMSNQLAQNWWVVALRGLLGVAFGILALLFPGITLLSLVLVFAAYMLVDGVLAIISAVRAARPFHLLRLLGE